MAIKPEADNVYFRDNSSQRDLALRLDEAFDVTFGAKRGELAFWLAEPKEHTRERFGLNQEVVVIYSPHKRTDARVMTAAAQIIRAPEFKYRVEKVLVLLIHNGHPQETAGLVKGQPDFIIVPFGADELSNPSRGSLFIRSKISEELGSIDLFGMSSPITSDKYFFGRDELVQGLVSRSVNRHESLGLFGLRKTGKTSVLYAVQRRLADRPLIADYLDCQNPGIHAARWWQVLDNLATRCANAARVPITGREAYTETDAGARFSADIKTLLERASLQQAIFMLDEVEYITPGLSGALGKHWDHDFLPFWQCIRAAHQETHGQVSFIVAGVNPACVDKPHFEGTPNPLFQLASPQYLEPLDVGAVREMVRSIGRYSGLRFGESVFAHLKDTYGGHPYLIRIACSEVWQATDTKNPDKLTSIGAADFGHRRAEIKARLSQPIKDILLSLVWWYPDEYELLQLLAGGDTEFAGEWLSESPESVVQFARYGILKPGAGEFAIADLRDFLTAHGESYKREISPFTRGDMPPELLPQIPDLEALGKLFEKRSEIEIRLRRAIILYLGVKFGWKQHKIAAAMIQGLTRRPDRASPAELFVGRSPQDVINDLYTLDLKSVVLANWDIFKALFDNNKSRFEMNMDTLNRARRVDGHAKPMSSEQALEFENSHSWLLSRLARVPE